LKIFLKRHKVNGPTKRIEINTDTPNQGFKEIDQALGELTINDPLAALPEKVMNAAKWLYDDDITVARSMLAEADRIENNIIRTNAKKELELLRRTINNKQIKTASYNVQMPAGRLIVSVHTPSSIVKFLKSLF
jgi:hypothetical protein